MKLEVRNHEVRSSNELPGLPYISEVSFAIGISAVLTNDAIPYCLIIL